LLEDLCASYELYKDQNKECYVYLKMKVMVYVIGMLPLNLH